MTIFKKKKKKSLGEGMLLSGRVLACLACRRLWVESLTPSKKKKKKQNLK
jgi:hypothetical protein